MKGSTTKTLSEIREVVLEYLQTNVSVFVNGNIDINDNECHHCSSNVDLLNFNIPYLYFLNVTFVISFSCAQIL